MKRGICIFSIITIIFILFVFLSGAILLASSMYKLSNHKEETIENTETSILTNEMINEAIASQLKYKVPASITLGQIILESRGKYPLPNGKYSRLAWEDKNLFGIKGKGDMGSRAYETNEYSNGQKYKIHANFARFSSFGKAIDRHGQLLSSPLYFNRVKIKNDANSWADALSGLYATDSKYGDTLKKIMTKYDLYRYNSMNTNFKKLNIPEEINIDNTQRKIVEVAKSYQNPYYNGYKNMCEKWVRQVYEKAGLNYSKSHCAAFARDRFAKRNGKIPVGALIYSSIGYKSGARCSICGRDAGHVGIYIGGGKVLSSMPRFQISLEEFIRIYGYGGYSFNSNNLGR